MSIIYIINCIAFALSSYAIQVYMISDYNFVKMTVFNTCTFTFWIVIAAVFYLVASASRNFNENNFWFKRAK